VFPNIYQDIDQKVFMLYISIFRLQFGIYFVYLIDRRINAKAQKENAWEGRIGRWMDEEWRTSYDAEDSPSRRVQLTAQTWNIISYFCVI